MSAPPQPGVIESANPYDHAIREHYDKVAAAEGIAATSTMADTVIRDQETRFISEMTQRFVSDQLAEFSASGGYAVGPGRTGTFSLVDVGCGNGYTLEVLSSIKYNLVLQGIEFNDSLRRIAESRLESKDIRVEKCDIRDSNTLPSKQFDILVCQRVLINLLDASHQKAALNNLVDLVSEKGILIFVEAFKSGLNNLNSARREFGLDDLPPAHHNLYLDDNFFEIDSIMNFDTSFKETLSSHYFVSRVLHPVFLAQSGGEFVRNSHFVHFFSKAISENVGEYAPLKFLAFQKN